MIRVSPGLYWYPPFTQLEILTVKAELMSQGGDNDHLALFITLSSQQVISNIVTVTHYMTSIAAGFPVISPGFHKHVFISDGDIWDGGGKWQLLEFSANTQFVVITQSCFSDTKITGSIQGPSCQSVLEKDAELSEHCLHSVNTWMGECKDVV